MNLTDEDKADLKAAQHNFTKMMSGLTPDQQIARAEVIAAGIRETDPLTQAMAQQVVDAQRLKESAASNQAEMDRIDNMNLGGYRPHDPNFRGRMLARRADAEQRLHADVARLIALKEEGLSSAQRRAVQYFRDLRRNNERQVRIAEAIARKQAEAEQAEIDAIADGIVKGGAFKIGKSRSAGDSQ